MLKGLLRDVVGEMLKKNNISARYRREAPISQRIILATRSLYVQYIAEILLISAKYITFSVVETIPNISYFWRFR